MIPIPTGMTLTIFEIGTYAFIVFITGFLFGVAVIVTYSQKAKKKSEESEKFPYIKKEVKPLLDLCGRCGNYRRDKDGRWIISCPYCNDYQP